MTAGSFGTEAQARAATAPAPGRSLTDGNVRLLENTLHGAGVDLGKWDARILDWLSGFEPSTCAVIAGWITRAHQAGGQS